MVTICANVLDKIVNHQFLMGAIFVAKHEDVELFARIVKLYVNIKNVMASTDYTPAPGSKPVEELLKRIALIDIDQLDAAAQIDSSAIESITYCLQPMLAVKVLQNPNSDTLAYVADLLMIQRLKNYSMPRLYCEVIRACLMSLYVSGTTLQSIWCAFTFIKVPHIIKQLSGMTKGICERSVKHHFSYFKFVNILQIMRRNLITVLTLSKRLKC